MKELDITGMLALGNGEPCPFCKGDDVFINSEDNDYLKHLMDNPPAEMNAALFRDTPPPQKPWVEQKFVLVVSKIAAILKGMEDVDKLPHEEYEIRMKNIYSIVSDYKKSNEGN